MSVYVDKPQHAFGRMVMCHMLADTPSELVGMADRIGVARRHFQLLSLPHFDICKAKRELAVKAGAIEVDRRGIYEVMKRLRVEMLANPEPWRALGKTEAKGDEQ